MPAPPPPSPPPAHRSSLAHSARKVITDFFDQVKSRSKGYASMEYQLLEWRDEELVRLDIKINGEDAPPLSTVCHRDQAYGRGKGGILFLSTVDGNTAVASGYLHALETPCIFSGPKTC